MLRTSVALLVAATAADAFAGTTGFMPTSAVGGRAKASLSASQCATTRSAPLGLKMEQEPLLLRAARGEKCYRDLVKKYPTFRERSEIPEVSTEISMQPFDKYGVDGCILFSDILTPLPGMGVQFDIKESSGPKLPPVRTKEEIDNIYIQKDWATAMPFVKQTLGELRTRVGNKATVLGFVGLPYTLATYLIEGGTSKEYLEIKKMMWSEPKMLHTMLEKLAENIGEYANFQIQSGAQVIQVFDSWAGSLSPEDYDVFALPYQKMVVKAIKDKNPTTPVIIYIAKSGALVERMASTGVDCVSLDWTVSIEEARRRIDNKDMIFQGNLDPSILYAPDHIIKERSEAIVKMGGGRNHIMNLGHGIEATTSEEKANFFVKTVQAMKH